MPEVVAGDRVAVEDGGGGVFWDFDFAKAFQTRVDANWIQFSSKSLSDDVSSKARVIPVRAGLNWMFGPDGGVKFYLGAMVGAYFQEVTVTENGNKTTQEETFFGFAPCVGARFPIGSPGNELEVFASYDMWTDDTTSADEDLDMGFVRMGVGYHFGI